MEFLSNNIQILSILLILTTLDLENEITIPIILTLVIIMDLYFILKIFWKIFNSWYKSYVFSKYLKNNKLIRFKLV
jgi:hypothetical protein